MYYDHDRLEDHEHKKYQEETITIIKGQFGCFSYYTHDKQHVQQLYGWCSIGPRHNPSCWQTHEKIAKRPHRVIKKQHVRISGEMVCCCESSSCQVLSADLWHPKVKQKMLWVELFYCILEACREKSTGRVLPLEKEWERERLSCSLFAGDDENTEQVIWKWITAFTVDTLRLIFLLWDL